MILVVGAKNSSNSNRLREIGAEDGRAELPDRRRQRTEPEWVRRREMVGITAGASAPEVLVDDVIDALRRLGARRSVTDCPGARKISSSACRPSLTAV